MVCKDQYGAVLVVVNPHPIMLQFVLHCICMSKPLACLEAGLHLLFLLDVTNVATLDFPFRPVSLADFESLTASFCTMRDLFGFGKQSFSTPPSPPPSRPPLPPPLPRPPPLARPNMSNPAPAASQIKYSKFCGKLIEDLDAHI